MKKAVLSTICLLTTMIIFGAAGRAQTIGVADRAARPESAAFDLVAVDWDYVALGDSITFGVGASSTATNYVSVYRNFLQTDNGVNVNLLNRGVSGRTSTQLLTALQTDTPLRAEIQSAEVITFNIGGNDLLAARAAYKANACGGTDGQNCLRTALATLNTNWDAIVAQILALRANNTVIVKTMDMYNSLINLDRTADTFPNDGGLTDLQAFKPYLDAANLHIRHSAAANNIALARVYLAYNTVTGARDAVAQGLIAADNVHPNDAGHSLIASTFRTAAAPSNAVVTIGGQVTDANGSPVRRLNVTATDIYGRTATALTNSFGFYRFSQTVSGETYGIAVASKRFQLPAALVHTVSGPRGDLNLTVNEL